MNLLLLQFGVENTTAAFGGLSVAFAMAQLLVNVFCAIGVANAIQQREAGGRDPLLVPRLVWIIGTFFTGLVGVLMYWVMHHSKLSREN